MRYLIALLIGFGLGYYAARNPLPGTTTGVRLNLSATPAPATPDWVRDPSRKTKLDATPAYVPWRYPYRSAP